MKKSTYVNPIILARLHIIQIQVCIFRDHTIIKFTISTDMHINREEQEFHHQYQPILILKTSSKR